MIFITQLGQSAVTCSDCEPYHSKVGHMPSPLGMRWTTYLVTCPPTVGHVPASSGHMPPSVPCSYINIFTERWWSHALLWYMHGRVSSSNKAQSRFCLKLHNNAKLVYLVYLVHIYSTSEHSCDTKVTPGTG